MYLFMYLFEFVTKMIWSRVKLSFHLGCRACWGKPYNEEMMGRLDLCLSPCLSRKEDSFTCGTQKVFGFSPQEGASGNPPSWEITDRCTADIWMWNLMQLATLQLTWNHQLTNRRHDVLNWVFGQIIWVNHSMAYELFFYLVQRRLYLETFPLNNNVTS